MSPRQQHFGWFLARGFGPQGWGHPYLDWNYDWTRPDIYQQAVRELEQAGIQAGSIRLSIGIEDLADLIADLDRGLRAVRALTS